MTPSSDTAGVRFPPPLVTLVAVLIGVLLQRVAPMNILPDDLRVIGREIGWIVLVLAIALGVWSVGLFARAGTTWNPVRPTTALVLHGPYRFTRNPMYLAFAIDMAGIALITNNLWILLMIIPDVVATRVLQIDREERYLSANFGAEYDAYRAQVRRWI